MAIAINEVTNGQLYTDAVNIAADILALKNKCTVFAERLYFIGIPDDPANGGATPVTGFVDALNLTKEDVAAAIGLTLDYRDFVTLGRVQVCAQLLRNSGAE